VTTVINPRLAPALHHLDPHRPAPRKREERLDAECDAERERREREERAATD
jgi:hypothetical protein